MKVLHTIRDTPPNPHGLCALSINNDNCFLAYPGSNLIGEVQIFDTINLVSYSKTCLKPPLKKRQNKGVKDKW